MTHLFGIQIDEKLPLWTALSLIPGIGKNRVHQMLRELGLNPYSSWENLTQDQKKAIDRWLIELLNQKKVSILGKDFFRKLILDTDKYISLGTYRGIRRRWGYPVRGQKTHSNAQTAKRMSPRNMKLQASKRITPRNIKFKSYKGKSSLKNLKASKNSRKK